MNLRNTTKYTLKYKVLNLKNLFTNEYLSWFHTRCQVNMSVDSGKFSMLILLNTFCSQIHLTSVHLNMKQQEKFDRITAIKGN